MLLTLLAPRAHILAMIAATLFVFAEQLESPAPLAWRWRGAGKALRIINAQARMRLAPHLARSARRLQIAFACDDERADGVGRQKLHVDGLEEPGVGQMRQTSRVVATVLSVTSNLSA